MHPLYVVRDLLIIVSGKGTRFCHFEVSFRGKDLNKETVGLVSISDVRAA